MRIRHYTLHDSIGSGAMGIVYKAIDERTRQTVAVKVLKPELAQYDAILLERFKREGQALRDLNHPNIVSLLDVFEEDGNHYLVMDYVSGGDLFDLIAADTGNNRLPLDQVLTIGIELSDALARAHHLGIIHRDLKPANVLIASDGTPRLTDFGIAHVNSAKPLTQTNQLLGTVPYLSPEACADAPLDHRADIWAFGVVLYEMLSGKRLFAANSLAQIIIAILQDPLPNFDLIRPDMPDRLTDLLYRTLERSKDARIPSMRLVGAELELIIKGFSPVTGQQSPRYVSQTKPLTEAKSDTDARGHNLPIQMTTFIGRRGDLAVLSDHLADPNSRLITLLGPGGIGKTRLAIELVKQQASAFENGACFVPLAPLSSSSEVPFAVATGLNVHVSAGDDPYERILEFVKSKSLLLLLDNFEHVLGGVSFVHQLVQDASGIKVIVTSRERLSLQYEITYTVGELSYPVENEAFDPSSEFDALTLFASRVRNLLPQFSLEDAETRRYANQICQLVHGHPLALGLAASWVQTLPLSEIVDELERSLDFLTTTMHDVAERHRGLRASFEYSWNLLTAQEQTVLMKLAVFRGGFTRQAAKTVIDLPFLTFSRLIDKSLVHLDANGRYAIHRVIQEFLLEKLQANPQQEFETHHKHWLYFADFVAQQTPLIKSSLYVQGVTAIDNEFTNFQAGWYWALAHELYDEMEKTLRSFWYYLSEKHSEEGRIMIQHAAEALGADNPANGSVLLWKIMAVEIYLVGYYRRKDVIEKLAPPVLDYMEKHSTVEWDYLIYVIIVWAEDYGLIDQQKTERLANSLLTNAKNSGDAWAFARVLVGTAWLYLFKRSSTELDKVESYLNESLALARINNLLDIQAETFWGWSVLESRRGNYQMALHHAQKAWALCIQMKAFGFAMSCCTLCIEAAIALEDFAQAHQYICQLLRFPNAYRVYWKQVALIFIAVMKQKEGDLPTAVAMLSLYFNNTPMADVSADMKTLRSDLQDKMPAETFLAAFNQGQTLDMNKTLQQFCEQGVVDIS